MPGRSPQLDPRGHGRGRADTRVQPWAGGQAPEPFGRHACGTASSTQPPKAAGSARATAVAASATPTAAAAAQFAAAADRICAVQNQRETALGPGLINADIVPVARLPKAATYLEKIIAIKNYGLPALRQLAATGPAEDLAARQAYIRDFQKVPPITRPRRAPLSRGT
jgi:hypothetical protein